MACDQWHGKLDAFVDGELESADTLERVQLKRSAQMAGQRDRKSTRLNSSH